jgi:hypothetical protein
MKKLPRKSRVTVPSKLMAYLAGNWLRRGGVVLLGEWRRGLWAGGEYWLTGGDILHTVIPHNQVIHIYSINTVKKSLSSFFVHNGCSELKVLGVGGFDPDDDVPCSKISRSQYPVFQNSFIPKFQAFQDLKQRRRLAERCVTLCRLYSKRI